MSNLGKDQSVIDNPYQAPSIESAKAATDYVSGTTIQLMRQTRPWILLLSVVGFVGSAVILLGAIVAGTILVLEDGLAGLAVMMVYGTMSLVGLIPSLLLYRFACRIQRFVISQLQQDLENALAAQRSFWKFLGILTLVVFGIYAALLAVAIVGIGLIGLHP